MLSSKDVLDKLLTPTQFRDGYDEREVDDFLDKVVAALRYYEQGGQPGPEAPYSSTQDVLFTPTKLRRGYDQEEVDAFLDQVNETVAHYERGGRPDPRVAALPVTSVPVPLGRRMLGWLRGDPRS